MTEDYDCARVRECDCIDTKDYYDVSDGMDELKRKYPDFIYDFSQFLKFAPVDSDTFFKALHPFIGMCQSTALGASGQTIHEEATAVRDRLQKIEQPTSPSEWEQYVKKITSYLDGYILRPQWCPNAQCDRCVGFSMSWTRKRIY